MANSDAHEKYLRLSTLFASMYYGEWEEFVTDGMGREEFVRTVVEFDGLDFVHPFVCFDTSIAPAGEKPEQMPELYSFLDLTKISAEDEDLLLWDLESKGSDYRVIFVPKGATQKLEESLREIIKAIVEESEALEIEEAEPGAMLCYFRESAIIINNYINDMGNPDDDDFDDDDFDDDYFDDLDDDDLGDFDDLDDEDLSYLADLDDESDDDMDDFGLGDPAEILAYLDDALADVHICYLDSGNYRIYVTD